MVTSAVADTVPAVAVKVAVVLPAATVTEAGTVRAALLSETETSRPPVGAALFRVTVQVVVAPDDTEAGEQLSADGTIGATRPSEALAVALLRLAVNVAVLSAVRVDAEAVKVAVEAPDAIVTDAGSVTKALLSDNVTTAPPVGAVPVKLTVHVADVPEPRELGAHANEDNPTGAAAGTVTTPPVTAVVMLSPASEDESAFEI